MNYLLNFCKKKCKILFYNEIKFSGIFLFKQVQNNYLKIYD